MIPYLQRKTSAAPLVVFRIMFGLMLVLGLVRFWSKGWIYELYIKPACFFSYYGFEWVRPLGNATYLLFAVAIVSAALVSAGYFYRVAAVALFLSFTYIELIDKSTYLNHYYFVSLICLLLIFLPAHTYFSFDARRNPALRVAAIPRWAPDSIKLMVFILYFYAGIAKINSDWLLNALPLRIWLPAKNDLPLIGFLFNYEGVAYLFSWAGCLYDLSIAGLLYYHRTRPFAYFTVVVFHLLTSLLFPIGMFPYIMIVTGLIFFPPEFHQKLLRRLAGLLRIRMETFPETGSYTYPGAVMPLLAGGLSLFFLFQLLFPFRYLLYPGELFWTEQGYRFSWRVMLMEKSGNAQFLVKDADGRQAFVNNADFLTTLQEKMMATQPDMLLQYAHMLSHFYASRGFRSPEVYADTYVSLNGRLGKPIVSPGTNLAGEKDSFRNKSWITPLNDEIKGF